jgi:myosin heavy subunit
MNAQNDYFTRLLERDSALCIQRLWRGFVCRDEFECAVHSTIDLQRVARGLLVRCEVKRQQHAASTIQQAWWDWVDYADMQLAATIIQNHWRAVSARKQYAKRILERNSVCAIQRVWRGYCQSTTYAITVEFIISIQRVTRGFLIRKELPIRRCRDAATNIQKAWRGFSAQVQFQLDILDIISIQTLARRNIALKDCARRVHSVVVLQGGIRCALARRALIERCENRKTQRRRSQAAIVCQVRMVALFLLRA